MKDKQSYKQGPITGLTPELMEGYVNRKLSPQLMRKVKEFLDKNPFEAEAIEGLKSQSLDLAGDLQDLEGRLSRKLSSRNNQFRFSWAVAAAVSLLAVSGVLFYFLMPDPADKVALNQETTETNTEQLEAFPETTLADDVAPAPAGEIKKETEIIEVPDQEEIEDFEEPREVNLTVETTAPVINNLAGGTQPNQTELANETNLQSDRTVALPIDNLIEEQAPLSAPPPSSVAAFGVDTPATAQGKAKRATAPAANSQVARAQNQPAELPLAEAPEGIMKYLKKHTKYPEAAKTKGVQGTVMVTFIVNEAGDLEDFEIVRELGYGCDEEAIKTIQQGPAWNPVEINGRPVKSRGQIEVAFPPQK